MSTPISQQAPSTESGRDYDGHAYVQLADGTWRVTAEGVERVEPDPSMLVVGRLPVGLGEDPGANAADDFLDAISCGDASVRAVLEEVMGACMTSAHVASRSVVLRGASGAGGAVDASNGKPTFVNLLKALVGSANVTCVSPEAMGSRFQAASIMGRLAVLADDINPGSLYRGRNSVFKQVVSGNAVHTDIKGRDGCDFTPMATVVLSLNGDLEVRGLDDGLRRRLMFVPFRAHFAEGEPGCDPHVAERIMRDGQAMSRLAWLALRGLRRLVANGRYTTIAGAAEALDEVARSGDPVASWVHEECLEYARDVCGRTTTEVYGRFRDWCERRGWEGVPNASVFSRRLARDGELVSTVQMAIEAGLVEAPGRWTLGTRPTWSQALNKTIRTYGLVGVG